MSAMIIFFKMKGVSRVLFFRMIYGENTQKNLSRKVSVQIKNFSLADKCYKLCKI